MTDGTTALPVSPVSEEDTMKLASLFSRASQAIVDASTMPKQIETLTRELEILRRDVERSHTHATELDHQLLEMRQQRNEAEDNLAKAKAEIATLTRNREELDQLVYEQQQEQDRLRADLNQTRTDRDDAILRAMQLEEDLGKAQATLKEFHAKVSAMFPPPAPVVEAKPVPTSDPIPHALDGSSSGQGGQSDQPVQANPDIQPESSSQAQPVDHTHEAQWSESVPPREQYRY